MFTHFLLAMPHVHQCYLDFSSSYIHFISFVGLHFLLGGFQSVSQGIKTSLSVLKDNTFNLSSFRLLLYRHHILDVVAGVVIGFFEAFLMAIIWLGPETCLSLVRWISDERNIGNDAELH